MSRLWKQSSTHDCTAHSAVLDLGTNTIRPLFIQTDTWCSSGQFNADGTLVQTGGDNDGFSKVISFFSPSCGAARWGESRELPPCLISDFVSLDFTRENSLLQTSRNKIKSHSFKKKKLQWSEICSLEIVALDILEQPMWIAGPWIIGGLRTDFQLQFVLVWCDPQIRTLDPCAGDGDCNWVETDVPLQNGRWYATNAQLPDGTQAVVGGRGISTVEYVPANGRGTTYIPLISNVITTTFLLFLFLVFCTWETSLTVKPKHFYCPLWHVANFCEVLDLWMIANPATSQIWKTTHGDSH